MDDAARPAPTPPPNWTGRLNAWIGAIVRASSQSPTDPLRSLATIAVAAATAVISYDTLYQLAIGMAFTNLAAHLFPIGLDAAVFGFTRAWFNRRLSQGTMNYARGAAVFFIAASVIGNGIEHARVVLHEWASERAVNARWFPAWGDWSWLVITITFSALMPLGLGLSLHLMAKIADDARLHRDRERAETEAKAAAEAAHHERKPAKKPAPKKPADAGPVPTKQDEPVSEPEAVLQLGGIPTKKPDWITDNMTAREAMFAYLDRNQDASGADLDRMVGMPWFGTKPSYGRTVKREWLAERKRDSRPIAVGEN